MPAPLVIAGLLAAGATIFGKAYDSIAQRIGKKKAKKAVERAVELQQKDKRSQQEEKELAGLLTNYPEIKGGFSQYGQQSNDPRFTKYSEPQLQTMGALRNLGLEQFQKQPYTLQDVANEEVRKFNQETIPTISSRFSDMGALRSGGFNRALARAQVDAQSRLKALGYEQQGKERERGLKALELGLQPQYGSHGVAGLGQQQAQQSFGSVVGSEIKELLKNPEFVAQAGQWWNELKQPSNPAFLSKSSESYLNRPENLPYTYNPNQAPRY